MPLVQPSNRLPSRTALAMPEFDAKEEKDVVLEEKGSVVEDLGVQAHEDLEVLRDVIGFAVEVPVEHAEDG